MRHKPFVKHTKVVEVKGASSLLSVMLYPVLLTRWCLSALSRLNLLFLSLVIKEATLKKKLFTSIQIYRGHLFCCVGKAGTLIGGQILQWHLVLHAGVEVTLCSITQEVDKLIKQHI